MPISLDNSLVFDGYADPSHDFTVGVGQNRILVIAIAAWGEIVHPSGLTFNGLGFTELVRKADPIPRQWAYIFYLVNPPVGTFELNTTTGWGYAGLQVASSWTGVHQTTPFGTPVTANGNSNSPSLSITAPTNEVVIDSFCVYNEIANASSPQTEIGATPNTYGEACGTSSYRQGTGSSMNMIRDTLSTTRNWAAIAVAMKEAEELVNIKGNFKTGSLGNTQSNFY